MVTIIYVTIGHIQSKAKHYDFDLNNSLSNDYLTMESIECTLFIAVAEKHNHFQLFSANFRTKKM